MSFELVSQSSSLTDITSNPTTVYTCPTGRTAIVISAIGTNTGANASSNATLSLSRGGSVTLVSKNIALASGTSVNVLPAKITLESGDLLKAYTTISCPFSASYTFIEQYSSGIIYSVLVNGSTIIAVCGNGIYRSTDSGVTWVFVSSIASTSSRPWVWIGSSIYLYKSTTTAIRSTDNGLTWTDNVAVTNAPTAIRSSTSGVVLKNGVYYSLKDSTYDTLISTTDGITWSNYGVAAPTAAASFAWSGSNWVLASASTTSVYTSADASSWTTVASVTSTSAGSPTNGISLATNGAGTLVVASSTAAATKVSTDHGVTWSTGSPSVSANAHVFYTGAKFMVFNSSNTTFYSSATGLSGDWTQGTIANTVYSIGHVVIDNRVVITASGSAYRSTDLALTQNNAVGFTVSAMEVF